MLTTQTGRGKDDYRCSYLLFLSHGHHFKLFLIQIMDPINEIPQCPAKCTLSCLSWHLGTLHKPALHASGQFCLWVIRSLSSLGSRGVNPPTHLAVQRKKRAESNSSGCTQHFEPGDFCLGSARDPKPMSFSRSSDDLGLKTSLNPSPAPPPENM